MKIIIYFYALILSISILLETVTKGLSTELWGIIIAGIVAICAQITSIVMMILNKREAKQIRAELKEVKTVADDVKKQTDGLVTKIGDLKFKEGKVEGAGEEIKKAIEIKIGIAEGLEEEKKK